MSNNFWFGDFLLLLVGIVKDFQFNSTLVFILLEISVFFFFLFAVVVIISFNSFDAQLITLFSIHLKGKLIGHLVLDCL